MHIAENEIYHIYNQGNNSETIFYSDEDYLEFLVLFRKYVAQNCKILAWCLMPNHFHFLIYSTEDASKPKRVGNIESNVLSNGFRLLLSNYTQYFNKKQARTGSLFRQKTKAKAMAAGSKNYQFTAFHYIHQNPLKAGLVVKLEDWRFSSFVDFAGLRNGSLCDKLLAKQLVDFDTDNFVGESYKVIDPILVPTIFEKGDMNKSSTAV